MVARSGWGLDKRWQIISICVGFIWVSPAIPVIAADPWYEKLDPKTRAAFEQRAEDYISINGYLWSAETLHATQKYRNRTRQSFHDLKAKGIKPFYYDPKTQRAVAYLDDVIHATPGVELIVGIFEVVTEEGILIALDNPDKALLVDHSVNLDEMKRGDYMRIAATRVDSQVPQDNPRDEKAIPRYKMIPADKKVSAEDLARYFHDNGITEFVQFDARKIVGPRAKKRHYVLTRKHSERSKRRKVCGKCVYRAVPGPEYEWRAQRQRIPNFYSTENPE